MGSSFSRFSSRLKVRKVFKGFKSDTDKFIEFVFRISLRSAFDELLSTYLGSKLLKNDNTNMRNAILPAEHVEN